MNTRLHNAFYNTPPLWKNKQFNLQQFLLPRVDFETFQPRALPQNLRLGHQMEYVFKNLIEASSEFGIVAHGLVVDEGKTRVGELDFILKSVTTGSFLHVELAYKFYLIDPSKSEPIYRLIGPNKRDMFFTKLDKLKQKQLPLVHHPALHKVWETYGIDLSTLAQLCCFKAQLFAPWEETVSIRPLNTDCMAGKWFRFAQLEQSFFKRSHFYIPHKMEWPLPPHHQVDWLNHFEALMEINLRLLKENAPMIWLRHKDGSLEKAFVVWW